MRSVKILYIILNIFLIGCSANNKNVIKSESTSTSYINTNIDSPNLDYIKQNISNLTLNIRNFGSIGETKSKDFLKVTLENYGYVVQIQDFPVYKQTFDSTLFVKSNKEYFDVKGKEIIGKGMNIIAQSKNYDLSKKTLYLTAHYDTTKDTIGTLDNATGVVVILEIARIIEAANLPINIEIVFFGGEEYYRAGSRYFLSKHEQLENILGCINIDTVAEKNAGDLVKRTFSGRNNILTLIGDTNLKVMAYGDQSDDLSFYMSKIPVFTITNDNNDPKKNKHENQMQFIDFNELIYTVNIVLDYILDFNLDKYNEIISSEEKHYTNLIKSNDLKKGYTLKEVNDKLIMNGFDSVTEFIYSNDKGDIFTIKEKSILVMNPIFINNFQTSKFISNFKYLIDNNKSKVYASNGIFFIESEGTISVDEQLKLLEETYRQY